MIMKYTIREWGKGLSNSRIMSRKRREEKTQILCFFSFGLFLETHAHD